MRLPSDAFKDNTGTEVTTNIIFLQKRDHLIDDIQLEWLNIAPNRDGIPINNYFVQHPEIVLGTMIQESKLYHGNEKETLCKPFKGGNLDEKLRTALGHIHGQITNKGIQTNGTLADTIPADSNVRNFSYTLIDGKLYYRENSVMYTPDLSISDMARAKGMVELRDSCRSVIDAQIAADDDEKLHTFQNQLNDIYDCFVSSYGRVNDAVNARAFNEDSSYYLLCALENMDENGRFIDKSDMFTKRTIRQSKIPNYVNNVQEALLLSVSEKARVYMSSLTGMTEKKLIQNLKGEIFRLPSDGEAAVYLTADEYLSGNVREKLEIALIYAEQEPQLYESNVEALEKVQPVPLTATDIDARLGAIWIVPKYIQDFIYELLQTPDYIKHIIEVSYSQVTSMWNISGKSVDSGNVLANTTYGTSEYKRL